MNPRNKMRIDTFETPWSKAKNKFTSEVVEATKEKNVVGPRGMLKIQTIETFTKYSGNSYECNTKTLN